MGLVINIWAYGDWERTYFVQDLDREMAKEKAFKMFKQTMSCSLPATLEELENDSGFSIEIIAEVEQIIL
jgi:hypothetical protein